MNFVEALVDAQPGTEKQVMNIIDMIDGEDQETISEVERMLLEYFKKK